MIVVTVLIVKIVGLDHYLEPNFCSSLVISELIALQQVVLLMNAVYSVHRDLLSHLYIVLSDSWSVDS